ncbi:MAG TPA: serine hydrolase [Chthoniobacterales bacterium]|nr:serine hydrolase [Chthoniobacterales bacterium]
MSTGGLSKSRLERMHQVLAGYVERKEMPGLVALVSRHDDVHAETLGTMAFGHPAPMERDTIFRIASITKPITAVAAMILVEECKLRLDESIEPWLPELANRRVLKSVASELDDTVPALRAITVRDLLTSRMGFGSVMAMPDTYPIQKFIREYRIGGDGPMLPSQAPGMDEWLQKLGSLPLLAQPGERWMYHVSIDVLGVLIARVSGQALGAFMRERIFDPLGMKDTAFHVSSEKIERLPAFYFFNHQSNTLDLFDDVAHSGWKDGRVEGWKGGRMEGWMEGWKGGRMEGWKEGRKDGWMDGWKSWVSEADGLERCNRVLRGEFCEFPFVLQRVASQQITSVFHSSKHRGRLLPPVAERVSSLLEYCSRVHRRISIRAARVSRR